jgi:hypothetical protein
MVLEKIGPLGWLRRRGLRKFEREWRIIELGQVCPHCAMPLEVSFEGNLTWYRCPGVPQDAGDPTYGHEGNHVV